MQGLAVRSCAVVNAQDRLLHNIRGFWAKIQHPLEINQIMVAAKFVSRKASGGEFSRGF